MFECPPLDLAPSGGMASRQPPSGRMDLPGVAQVSLAVPNRTFWRCLGLLR